MARKKIKIPGNSKRNKLSPEQYIRTKARNLPIECCFIFSDWAIKGMTQVVVVRGHKSGNKTIGIYLVDLYCLGVKDTFFLFNVPESTLNQLLARSDNIVEEDYALVHHIVYGAVDYAGNWGFEPHEQWHLTQYIMEHENANIPLVPIEFGREGKPTYISGPYDDVDKVNSILQTLETMAGPGNYHYIVAPD